MTTQLTSPSMISKFVLGAINGAALKFGEGAMALSPDGISLYQLFGYSIVGIGAFIATDAVGSVFGLDAYVGPSAASYAAFSGKNIAGIVLGGATNGLVYYGLMKIGALRDLGWFGAAFVGYVSYSIYRAMVAATQQ